MEATETRRNPARACMINILSGSLEGSFPLCGCVFIKPFHQQVVVVRGGGVIFGVQITKVI
eukprot:1193986-Prorocentrum_minimum.AAC.3